MVNALYALCKDEHEKRAVAGVRDVVQRQERIAGLVEAFDTADGNALRSAFYRTVPQHVPGSPPEDIDDAMDRAAW
jgi:hypothetical protein